MTRARDRRPEEAVASLCRAHDFDGDPRDLIRRLCRTLLSEAGTGIPTELALLASFQNVIRIEELPLDHDAHLGWDGRHYVIQVRLDHSAGRRRFSTGHELVHTFFPGARTRSDLPEHDIGLSRTAVTEEHLCDLGAAELLMPEERFAPALPRSPGMEDVLRLSEMFQASIEATARRVLRLCRRPGAVVVLEPKLKPSELRSEARGALHPGVPPRHQPGPIPKLRVEYSDSTGPRYIPQNKSVADGSPLAGVLSAGAVDYVGSTGLIDGVFRVSARHLPYERDGRRVDRVVALLFPV